MQKRQFEILEERETDRNSGGKIDRNSGEKIDRNTGEEIDRKADRKTNLTIC